jgi:hypothetical protein
MTSRGPGGAHVPTLKLKQGTGANARRWGPVGPTHTLSQRPRLVNAQAREPGEHAGFACGASRSPLRHALQANGTRRSTTGTQHAQVGRRPSPSASRHKRMQEPPQDLPKQATTP